MFDYLCKTQSDINEHLPTLRDLASECESITEMGVRYIVSTWAFAEGLKNGGKLLSIDIKHPKEYGATLTPIENHCKSKGILFGFFEGDTLAINIESCDMLFIDTLHTYEQLKGELARHSDKAKKYIVLHDTTSCPDMYIAVEEFLKEGVWEIQKRYTNNNGLTILKRV